MKVYSYSVCFEYISIFKTPIKVFLKDMSETRIGLRGTKKGRGG